MTLRRNYSVKTKRRQKALKRKVWQAFDRNYDRWEKSHDIDATPDDCDDYDFRPRDVSDKRNFEREFIETIDRDRMLLLFRTLFGDEVSSSELKFMLRYLDRDEHDPPTTPRERQQFCRLRRRLKVHFQLSNCMNLLGSVTK